MKMMKVVNKDKIWVEEGNEKIDRLYMDWQSNQRKWLAGTRDNKKKNTQEHAGQGQEGDGYKIAH